METTFEISAFDLIEKGMGLIACTAGCIYGGTLLHPELPLKALQTASLYATLGLGAIAIIPRTYYWIDMHIQEIVDGAVLRVQNFIEDHPLATFTAVACASALGCGLATGNLTPSLKAIALLIPNMRNNV